MKKCYIHIGVHKTGTTAIQIQLGKQRAALRRHGICIPVAGNAWSRDVGYHHNLAFELNEDPRFVPERGGLQALFLELEHEECPTVVVSSEDLCFTIRDPEKLARLRDPLVAMGYQVEWIIYFRTYPEWAESAYIEFAKSLAVARTFDYWARQKATSILAGIDPAGVLAAIKKTGDVIQVHSYALARNDVTKHFFSLIGAPEGLSTAQSNTKRANSRLSIFEVEYLRYLSVFKIRHVSIPQRQQFIAECHKLMKTLPPGPPYRGLSTETARHLYESSREAYEELLREHRPDATMDEFFPLAESYEPVTIDHCGTSPEDRMALYQLVSGIVFDTKHAQQRASSIQ